MKKFFLKREGNKENKIGYTCACTIFDIFYESPKTQKRAFLVPQLSKAQAQTRSMFRAWCLLLLWGALVRGESDDDESSYSSYSYSGYSYSYLTNMTSQGLDQFSSSEKPGNRCDPTCREQLRVWCHQWFNALRAREALPPVRRMPNSQMESCADRRAEYDSQLQRDGMPEVNATWVANKNFEISKLKFKISESSNLRTC